MDTYILNLNYKELLNDLESYSNYKNNINYFINNCNEKIKIKKKDIKNYIQDLNNIGNYISKEELEKEITSPKEIGDVIAFHSIKKGSMLEYLFKFIMMSFIGALVYSFVMLWFLDAVQVAIYQFLLDETPKDILNKIPFYFTHLNYLSSKILFSIFFILSYIHIFKSANVKRIYYLIGKKGIFVRVEPIFFKNSYTNTIIKFSNIITIIKKVKTIQLKTPIDGCECNGSELKIKTEHKNYYIQNKLFADIVNKYFLRTRSNEKK